MMKGAGLKRVLYVHHSGELGGAPRSLGLLIEHLDRSRWDPTVVTIRPGPVVGLFRQLGVKTIVDRWLSPFHGSHVSGMSVSLFIKNLLFVIPTYLRARFLLRAFKPEVLHLNSTCMIVVAAACRHVSPQTKIVVHIREPLLPSWVGGILRFLNHRYADAFVAIDRYDASTVNTSDRPVEVINNFVAIDEFVKPQNRGILRQEIGLLQGEFLVMYLARFAPSNGALELLSLMGPLLKKRSNVHLALVGGLLGRPDAYTKKVIDQSKGLPRTHIVEFRTDIADVLSSADVHVCPFTQPHFARSIVEAATLGIPSLATDIGGPRELVEHGKTGFLFDLKDHLGFVRLLESVLDDRDLRETLGKNAATEASQRFDAKVNAARTAAIYDRFFANEAGQ